MDRINVQCILFPNKAGRIKTYCNWPTWLEWDWWDDAWRVHMDIIRSQNSRDGQHKADRIWLKPPFNRCRLRGSEKLCTNASWQASLEKWGQKPGLLIVSPEYILKLSFFWEEETEKQECGWFESTERGNIQTQSTQRNSISICWMKFRIC